ncbi:hypothetical protein [Bdellovibrio bacteriovorus]|nr:hypothetical protein [Bdellovibrio bacteriovorus]
MDTFLGTSEPAYVQAVAPRFSKWVIENFSVTSSAEQKKWQDHILQESAQMTDWNFTPLADFSWPRLQFGMRFTKGVQTDSYIFIFPENPKISLQGIQKFFRIPSSLQRDWIGYGISLQKNEVYLFNKESNAIRQTIVADGKWLPSTYLRKIEVPKESPVSFASLVVSWKSWLDAEGRFLQYELNLGKFNLRVLDGAAIATARKLNGEFLLNNLRLTYRSLDDYDVLYP